VQAKGVYSNTTVIHKILDITCHLHDVRKIINKYLVMTIYRRMKQG